MSNETWYEEDSETEIKREISSTNKFGITLILFILLIVSLAIWGLVELLN